MRARKTLERLELNRKQHFHNATEDFSNFFFSFYFIFLQSRVEMRLCVCLCVKRMFPSRYRSVKSFRANFIILLSLSARRSAISSCFVWLLLVPMLSFRSPDGFWRTLRADRSLGQANGGSSHVPSVCFRFAN